MTHDAANNTYRCPASETMSHEIEGKRYERDSPIDRLICRTNKGMCQRCVHPEGIPRESKERAAD